MKSLNHVFATYGAALLTLLMLSGCPKSPSDSVPQPASSPQALAVQPYQGLAFDMRYYDSIEMHPRSARTERELAIFTQLLRLERIQADLLNAEGQLVPLAQQPNPPFDEQIGEGRVQHFEGKAEALADIYRKIDSLKVLEQLPLTPHLMPH